MRRWPPAGDREVSTPTPKNVRASFLWLKTLRLFTCKFLEKSCVGPMSLSWHSLRSSITGTWGWKGPLSSLGLAPSHVVEGVWRGHITTAYMGVRACAVRCFSKAHGLIGGLMGGMPTRMWKGVTD